MNHLVLVVIPTQHCQALGFQPEVLTSEQGYLSNFVTEETGCGIGDKPWRIRVELGRRIELRLIDFAFSLRRIKH